MSIFHCIEATTQNGSRVDMRAFIKGGWSPVVYRTPVGYPERDLFLVALEKGDTRLPLTPVFLATGCGWIVGEAERLGGRLL